MNFLSSWAAVKNKFAVIYSFIYMTLSDLKQWKTDTFTSTASDYQSCSLFLLSFLPCRRRGGKPRQVLGLFQTGLLQQSSNPHNKYPARTLLPKTSRTRLSTAGLTLTCLREGTVKWGDEEGRGAQGSRREKQRIMRDVQRRNCQKPPTHLYHLSKSRCTGLMRAAL